MRRLLKRTLAASRFTFERGATKATGATGGGCMEARVLWVEFKGKHANLSKAYHQTAALSGRAGEPAVARRLDMDRIEVRTHFPNTPTRIHELTLDGLADDDQLAVLRAVFHDPDKLRPEKTIQHITEERPLASPT